MVARKESIVTFPIRVESPLSSYTPVIYIYFILDSRFVWRIEDVKFIFFNCYNCQNIIIALSIIEKISLKLEEEKAILWCFLEQ